MKIKTWKALLVIVFSAGFFAAIVWGVYEGWHREGEAAGSQKLENLMFVGSQIVYSDINQTAIDSVRNSPFDSYAMVLTPWGQEVSVPDFDNFRTAINAVKDSEKKFWPRIMMSRMASHLSDCNTPNNINNGKTYYFLDIWNQGNCYADFKNMLLLALRIAKETETGGIAVDPEMYNNYNNMRVGYLAAKYGKTAEETHQRLLQIGGELADVINGSSYPDATIWSLYSDFSKEIDTYSYPDSYRVQAGVYILEGMLKRAKEQNYRLKLVDGGESSLGYLHNNLSDLRQKTDSRLSSLASYLNTYSNFHLGGTIGLYLTAGTSENPGVLEIWQDKFKSLFGCEIYDSCNSLRTVDDFLPLLRYLFEENKYVWVYRGYGIPQYNDFDFPDNDETKGTEQYREVIQSAMNGNGACETDRNETCRNSPQDCGTCPVPPPASTCPDGQCRGDETCSTCPADCGACVQEDPYTPSISIKGKARLLSSTDPYHTKQKEFSLKGRNPEVSRGKVRVFDGAKRIAIIKVKSSGSWSGKIKTKKPRTWNLIFRFYDRSGAQIHETQTFQVVKVK